VISVKLREETLDKIRTRAKSSERSVGAEIRVLIEDGLKIQNESIRAMLRLIIPEGE
jgi:plasmid stability protein